jgi:hypothetical protein
MRNILSTIKLFLGFKPKKTVAKTYIDFVTHLEKTLPHKDSYVMLTQHSLEYGLLTNKFILVEKPNNKFVLSFFILSDPQFVALVYGSALEYFNKKNLELQASFVYKLDGSICLTTDPNFRKVYESLLTPGKVYDSLSTVPTTQPVKKSEMN